MLIAIRLPKMFFIIRKLYESSIIADLDVK